MSKNIAVIRTIEFEDSGFFFPVEFIPGTGSFTLNRQQNNAGPLYKSNLKFRLSGIKTSTEEMLERIYRTDRIALEDVNGTRILLGSSDHPVKVESEESIAGHPGGFIGYEVTVTWDHPDPPTKRSFIQG